MNPYISAPKNLLYFSLLSLLLIFNIIFRNFKSFYLLSDRENVSDESAFYMFRESPLETVISYPIFCILCFKERRLSAASSPVHSLLS